MSLSPVTQSNSDHVALANSPFKDLAEEVIVQIFGYLPLEKLNDVAQVCKCFNRIRTEPRLNEIKVQDLFGNLQGKFRLNERAIELSANIEIRPLEELGPLSSIFSDALNSIKNPLYTGLQQSYYCFLTLNNSDQRMCFAVDGPSTNMMSCIPPSDQLHNPMIISSAPSGVNINALVTRGKWIRFTGSSEIDQRQAAAKQLFVEWAQHLREHGKES